MSAPCSAPPKRAVIGKRDVERDAARARRVMGRVSMEPHRPSECPRLRGDTGPCPFVSCKKHLWGESTRYGSIVVYRPGEQPLDLPETCAIDVAIRGETSLADIGWLCGISECQTRDVIKQAMGSFLAAAGEQRAFADESAEQRCGVRQGGLAETGRAPGWMVRGEVKLVPPELRAGGGPVEVRVVVVMAKRTIELTEEQIRLKSQCPELAARLFDLLLINPGVTGGLRAVARMYTAETRRSVNLSQIHTALETLAAAGLVAVEWECCGGRQQLRSVSPLVTVVPSGGKPGCSPLREATE